jgi:hypothetical protein
MSYSAKLSNYQFAVPDGFTMHSITQFTATIANHSARAAMAGYLAAALTQIPGIAGKIYTLVGIEFTVKSTLTTAVPTGGLFDFTNDGIDWLPFQFITNTSTVLGAAGGVSQSPCFIPMHKPLPAGSNVTCYYTSQNAATDWASTTLFWSTREWNPAGEAQTYSAYGLGTTRTSVGTFAADITIAIPANKGGDLVGFLAQIYGTIVTILSVGGNIVVHNTAALVAYEPTMFVTGSYTCIASGGGEMLVTKVDWGGDCPGNSTFTFDTTTISTNSQTFGVCVVWEA